MAGADGVIVEVHESPVHTASDGQQSMDFQEAARAYDKMRTVRGITEGYNRSLQVTDLQ